MLECPELVSWADGQQNHHTHPVQRSGRLELVIPVGASIPPPPAWSRHLSPSGGQDGGGEGL